MQTKAVTINFTGGIISPGYLKTILKLAQEAKVGHVRFGLRQQLRLEVPAPSVKTFLNACAEKGIIAYKSVGAPPNVVSSYPAAAIFTFESWMREGVYKDIFDSFTHTPKIKINICDSCQQFVPFYTGHINWVTSSSPHFWHLYVRFPKTATVYQWKELVYTNDIPLLSQALEKEMGMRQDNHAAADPEALFRHVKAAVSYIGKEPVAASLNKFSLPYYEGFNRINNQLWLGIYRRNEKFPVAFLLDVCNLCLQTKVGQLYTTPWKSIIIKNIDPLHRRLWDHVLGRYRINVRHAANELNWQVEDDTEKGLQLKSHIIRHFDKEDVRTYGLCFAVQTKPAAKLFGSVIVRKQQNKNPHRLKALERYDILYKKEFNPNASEEVLFRQGVEKDFIGTYLVSLCKQFYEAQSELPLLPTETPALQAAAGRTVVMHQCRHCQTVYVPGLGDEAQGIAPGTGFENLPLHYNCPLCDAPKEAFVQREEAKQ